MAGIAASPASGAAMARYERRLWTMTSALLSTDGRRAILGHIAARAWKASGADLAAVLIRDADGVESILAPTNRWAASGHAAWRPESRLVARRLGNLPSKPRLIRLKDGGVGPAMVSIVVSTKDVSGLLLVARRPGARPFAESDLKLLAPYCTEARLAITFAKARFELERGVLAKDRSRIARELHDGVIQSLYGIGLVLEGIRSDAVRPHVKDQLSGLTESINFLIDDLRAYINDLTPPSLAKRGLGAELCSLAKEFQATTGVVSTVRLNGAVDEIGVDLGRDLVQITREALANVAKHADASRVMLRLRRGAQTIRLEISDDGRGLAPAHNNGRGLPNILRRVQAWDGKLEIRPIQGGGTAIRASVPARTAEAGLLERMYAPASRAATLGIAVSAGLAVAG